MYKKEKRKKKKSDNDLEESVIGHTRNFSCKEHSPVGVGGGGPWLSFDTYGFSYSLLLNIQHIHAVLEVFFFLSVAFDGI